MSEFALKTALPQYLRVEQEKIQSIAADEGLDFFPTVFEILTYQQMNEIAAYGGFPNRYPHWRFGMEYERLAKSYEYGLSKIYEMVINNNPSYAYLLEGNSLVDQKLVMAHVYGHVDFFKNNYCFRATDLDTGGRTVDPAVRSASYNPNRRWIDKMANHGSRIRRHVGRIGINKVEEFVDQCLSLENLIDPHAPFHGRRPKFDPDAEEQVTEVPRLKSKDYMESFINPSEYIEEQKKKIQDAKRQGEEIPRALRARRPDLLDGERPARTLGTRRPRGDSRRSFLLRSADADEDHERGLGELLALEAHDHARPRCVRDHRLCREQRGRHGDVGRPAESLQARRRALTAISKKRWNKGQFGKEWEECDDLEAKRHWNLRLGLGKKKIFEVRSLYNDVTFIDEFLTADFCRDHKLFSFSWSNRNERFEIETREFKQVKEKLLFQLTNAGSPFIYVEDANFENRGELLLRHDHQGIDLRADYAKEVMKALVRVWKRPVNVTTLVENKPTMMRFDGKEATSRQTKS